MLVFVQELSLTNKANQNLSSPARQPSVDGNTVNGASQPNVPVCKYAGVCFGYICTCVCAWMWEGVVCIHVWSTLVSFCIVLNIVYYLVYSCFTKLQNLT